MRPLLLFVAASAQAAGAHSMTETISQLVQLLCRDVSVAEISARVGPVVHDQDLVELKPKLHGVQAALVTRFHDRDEPYTLDLELRPSARPTVASMRKQFGDFEKRVKLEQPTRLTFHPPPGAHWKVLLTVDVDSPGGDVKDADKVVSVSFRRDRLQKLDAP